MPGVNKRHNDSGVNALVAAAESGDVEAMRQLLDVVDPNSQTVVSLRCRSNFGCKVRSSMLVLCGYRVATQH